jgi:hypothetical protein
MCNILDINESTLTRWKKDPMFLHVLKAGKDKYDNLAVKSLAKRVMGYEYDEITYEKSKTGGLEVGLKKEEIETIKHSDAYKTKIVTKQVIPDVTAQIFWLKNRQPDKWRDKPPEDNGDNSVKTLEIKFV